MRVPASVERREDHCLQHTAGAGISWHSEIARRQYFLGRRAVASAADEARRLKWLYFEAERFIELHNAVRPLVREDDRPGMLRKPFRRAFLFFPAEAAFRILREFNIVRRVGVDEIVVLHGQIFEVAVREFKSRED